MSAAEKRAVLEAWVKSRGGKRVIQRILIANNGLAAVRAIRALREWSFKQFGDSRILHFVAMATPEDVANNAEYFRLADDFVVVPGGSNKNNFANVDLVVEYAQECKVDAVWPGWGHASEYPSLPAGLDKVGITFLGPRAQSMDAVGDKINANLLAQSVGVNVIPWSGSGLKSPGLELAPELIRAATLQSVEEAVAKAKDVGFPMMIKASEGGGGKGIRKVTSMDELKVGFVQVQKEVPGSPIFIQKLGVNARHLEVQVLADEYGNAISLYGRDCSVQRRHQKLFEEGPVQVADAALRHELETGAVRLAKFVGYRSAGTVEYLYSVDSGEYSFLEVNPRLQVEHVVTEAITGVCVPACQLCVGMGLPLYAIPDVRNFYGADPAGATEIDLGEGNQAKPKCHCIAARITAEDIDDGFKPTSGRINEMYFRPVAGVDASFSVSTNGGVHQFADSQFGHLFSRAATREQARKNLLVALKEFTIRGEISNNLPALRHIAACEDFINDTHHTGWLDVKIANKDAFSEPVEARTAVVCASVVTARSKYIELESEVVACLERGVVPDKATTAYTKHKFDLLYSGVKYTCNMGQVSEHRYKLVINDSEIMVEGVMLYDGGTKVCLDGNSYSVYSERTATGLKVIIDGITCFFPDDADPTALQTVSAGKLLGYLVEDQDTVQPGQPYAEIEVMKTVMPLVAQNGPGKVTLLKSPGAPIEAGEVLARIQLAEGVVVKRAEKFTGKFAPSVVDQASCGKLRQFELAKNRLVNELCGFTPISDTGDGTSFDDVFDLAYDPEVLVLCIDELLKVAVPESAPRVKDCLANIREVAKAMLDTDQKSLSRELLNGVSELHAELQVMRHENELDGLRNFAELFTGGQYTFGNTIIMNILQHYLKSESVFEQAASYQDAVLELRKQCPTNMSWQNLAIMLRSHAMCSVKNKIVIAVLNRISQTNMLSSFVALVSSLANLEKEEHLEVAQKAKEVLFRADQLQRKTLRRGTFSGAVTGLGVRVSSNGSMGSGDKEEDEDHISPNPPGGAAPRSKSLDANLSIEAVTDLKDITGTALNAQLKARGEPKWTAFFDKSQRKLQAEELKKYFGGFGINNVICTIGGEFIKVQCGNGLTFYVAVDISAVPKILAKASSDGFSNRIGVLLSYPQGAAGVEVAPEELSALMQNERTSLLRGEITKVSFTLLTEGQAPQHFTYCRRQNFAEDPKARAVEPTLMHQLELDRLSNFDCTQLQSSHLGLESDGVAPEYRIHTFLAQEKTSTADSRAMRDRRTFVRAVVYNRALFIAETADAKAKLRNQQRFAAPKLHSMMRRTRSASGLDDDMETPPPINDDNVLVDILGRLELAVGEKRTAWNYIFVNLVADPGAIDAAEETVRLFLEQFSSELGRLKVAWVEVKVGLGRIVAYNPAGHRFKVERYFDDEVAGEADQPYPVLNRHQRKQLVARNNGSTYVYDFLELFQDICAAQDPLPPTTSRADDVPFRAVEMVINLAGNLEETARGPGHNEQGMVVWRCWMRTPECRQGREIILVASDLSTKSGSFSLHEDYLYQKAFELACQQGLPCIYIAANSGARIGLNENMKKTFRVAWVDDQDHKKGFKYLYITPEEQKEAEGKEVITERVEDEGEVRYKIVDILGGSGVECLAGSGIIASATSAAYEETFTLSYVTGRSVGIGAYVSRLSQRVIQHVDAPLILTGAAALNKVLGRPVYSSNLQIGGAKGVMGPNGVCHLQVRDDAEGVSAIVRWLSYVPARRGGPLLVTPSVDPVDREVEFTPAGLYDPRHMFSGVQHADGEWQSGFFDRNSFTETLADWGKTVVCGRARLAGIPIGVIGVETRMQERYVPADPGFPGSQVQVMTQAGNVWFPDSAYKTAQACNDFDQEGLPLMIFANWRGFAGGQRDMFDEVLKYGSYIVDALRKYKQPIFVYLPSGAELRGGAWVVIDPNINPVMMSMYSAENARGNVLEPEGIVEIKFRTPDLLAAMKRLDPEYASLSGAAAQARAKELLPIYKQLATAFAALHDTPGVMKAKQVLEEVVPWATSRQFFAAKLRHRLQETKVKRELLDAHPNMNAFQRAETFSMLHAAMEAAPKGDVYSGKVNEVIRGARSRYVFEQAAKFGEDNLEAVIKGLLMSCTAAEVSAMLDQHGDFSHPHQPRRSRSKRSLQNSSRVHSSLSMGDESFEKDSEAEENGDGHVRTRSSS